MLLEQLERQVLADLQAAAVFKAAGAKDVELPDLAKQRAVFDAALVEVPKPGKKIDSEQMELRRVLGVA